MFAQARSLISFAQKPPSHSISSIERELYDVALDFSSVTVDIIQQHLAQIRKLFMATYDAIAALRTSPVTITFTTAVQPLIDLNIFIDKARSLCIFPMDVHGCEDVRNASAAARKEFEKLEIECEQREDVFEVLKMYEDNAYQNEKSQLHFEENRYFTSLMRQYKRSGLSIADSAVKKRVAKIKTQISELGIDFDRNLEEEKTSFLMGAAELDGLPKTWFNKSREISPGIYRVTMKYPDVFPILDYATNRDTRKKIFLALEMRCANENLLILKKILELRNELAVLLGYGTHASYVAETRMVKTSENVKKFLDDMNQRFTPLLEENLKDLTDFARAKEYDDNLQLEVFDMRYYMRLREEALCEISMEKVKEYFPLERVIQGTLSIYEKLLGLRFVKNKNVNAWHSDVEFFDVYNYDHASQACGDKIGGFYLDLYPREGKYAHAAAYPLQHGCDVSHLSATPDERQSCIAAMVCNFPRDENLPFNNVITFFHEFGHIMHYICSRTKLAAYQGDKVELDFVEAPSKMLENWCYEPAVLRILSAHYQTQEPLPQEMAEKIREKQKIHAGYLKKKQLVYAIFDYCIHSMSVDELRQLDLKSFYQQVQHRTLQLPIMEESCFPASFAHLVHGYSAGYYSYMMAETYAADMYAAVFQQSPLSPSSGAQYRQCVLEPGASQDAIEILTHFLGREPRIDAFLINCGLNLLRKRRLSELFRENSQDMRGTPVPPVADATSLTSVRCSK